MIRIRSGSTNWNGWCVNVKSTAKSFILSLTIFFLSCESEFKYAKHFNSLAFNVIDLNTHTHKRTYSWKIRNVKTIGKISHEIEQNWTEYDQQFMHSVQHLATLTTQQISTAKIECLEFFSSQMLRNDNSLKDRELRRKKKLDGKKRIENDYSIVLQIPIIILVLVFRKSIKLSVCVYCFHGADRLFETSESLQLHSISRSTERELLFMMQSF